MVKYHKLNLKSHPHNGVRIMGDATASIIFNLIYLVFLATVLRKMQRKWGNDSLNLVPQYSVSQLIGQWRDQILRLSSRKWAQ